MRRPAYRVLNMRRPAYRVLHMHVIYAIYILHNATRVGRNPKPCANNSLLTCAHVYMLTCLHAYMLTGLPAYLLACLRFRCVSAGLVLG